MSARSLPLLACAALLVVSYRSTGSHEGPEPAGDTTVTDTVERGAVYAEDSSGPLEADIYTPTGPVTDSTVVILHGQGMKRTAPGPMALAGRLQRLGVLVVVPDYRAASPAAFAARDARSLRSALHQVACAIELARHRALAAGGDSGRLVLVGESAGGLVGLAAALRTPIDEDAPAEETECLRGSAGRVPVDGFVSWNGAIFIYAPESPFHDPTAWDLTDPTRLATGDAGVEARFVLGGRDDRTPEWHSARVAALAEAVSTDASSALIELATAEHNIPSGGSNLDALVDLVMELAGTPTS